jgi:hypothetical protein
MTGMNRHRGRMIALIASCCCRVALAGDLPQVAVVSRAPASIGMTAKNFEAKPGTALFYRVHFNGSSLIGGNPLPDSTFDIPTEEPGVYTLTIVSRKSEQPDGDVKEKVLWEQDLFAIRHSGRLGDRDMRERLAHAYAPVALFHREEEFYPSSIPYILNEESPDPELADEAFQVKIGRLDWTSIKYRDLGQFLSMHADRSALVDTPRLRKVAKAKIGEIAMTRQRFRTASPKQATLYYSILEAPGGARAYINYHFLYAYDPKSGTSEDPSKVGHVFDRESLTVILDMRTLRPEAVIFGAHLPDQTMGYFTIEGDEVFKWQGGRVRIPWESVDKISGYPVAAVARGSHGIYPLPGLYAVLEGKVKLLKEAAGGNRVLVPPDLARSLDRPADSTTVEIVPYSLLELGLDEATSFSWNRILIFSGSLVDVPGSTNAKFPPFTTREMDPASYGDGAALWPVDRIPESSRDHIDLLIELLGSSGETPGNRPT